MSAVIETSKTVGPGHVQVTATLGTMEQGSVNGKAWITRPDGHLLWKGSKEHSFGVKTTGSTWHITFDVHGPNPELVGFSLAHCAVLGGQPPEQDVLPTALPI